MGKKFIILITFTIIIGLMGFILPVGAGILSVPPTGADLRIYRIIDAISGDVYQFNYSTGNYETYIGGGSEVDPVFTASPSYGISSGDITNWNGKLSYFNEADPLWVASASHGINAGDITNWNTAFGWGNHANFGYLTGNQSISLSGDLSGSGETSINGTVNGLKGIVLPSLSTGYLYYTGSAWNFQTPAGSSGGMTTLMKPSNQTINSGAGVYTDITGLTFPVVSGKGYAFKFYIVFQSSATTTGYKASVNCPTGTVDFFVTHQTVANSSTVGVATWLQRHSVTRDDMTVLTATITASVDLVVMIEGRYLCTANGTFAARFANELASNTNLVVQAGSWGYYFESTAAK